MAPSTISWQTTEGQYSLSQLLIEINHLYVCRSYLSGIEVRELQPEAGDGELDVGPSFVHARRLAQHPSHFFVGSAFFVNRFKARSFTDPVDAFPEKKFISR